jgi:hypothetical protein
MPSDETACVTNRAPRALPANTGPTSKRAGPDQSGGPARYTAARAASELAQARGGPAALCTHATPAPADGPGAAPRRAAPCRAMPLPTVGGREGRPPALTQTRHPHYCARHGRTMDAPLAVAAPWALRGRGQTRARSAPQPARDNPAICGWQRPCRYRQAIGRDSREPPIERALLSALFDSYP